MWFTMLLNSVVLLNSRNESACMLSSLKKICKVTSRIDLLGCLYRSVQMGVSRDRSSHVRLLRPSRKQHGFSGSSLGVARVVSVHLMVLWIRACAAALSCRAISLVQLWAGAVVVSGMGAVFPSCCIGEGR